MLNIGHRGASGYEPENTLRSFRRAIEMGVDMIELDVYVCKSGELVVIHDQTVNRTTNGKGYVQDLSLDELKVLDAGKGEKIPTLGEVLDLVDRRVGINIELKGEGTAIPVARLIASYVKTKGWRSSDFLISSFNHYELLEFKRQNTAVRLGALFSGVPLGYNEFVMQLEPYSVNLDAEVTTKALVDDAHQRGLKVLIWTVNDAETLQRMKQMGADGVFTNFPDLIKHKVTT